MAVNKTGSVHTTQHWGALVQPLLQCKSNKYYLIWVCVCSLRHPARKAHAPYCHPWPARPYDIFPYYLITSKIFEQKKLLNTKSVVTFPTTFLDIFSKNSKLHKNPSSRNRVSPRGHNDGQPNMTTLTAAFRNFAKAPSTATELGTT